MEIANIHLSHGGGNQTPRRLIVHAMAQYIDNGEDDLSAWQLLDKLGLSAHYLVEPSGVIIQCRHENEIAWHAKKFNQDSIGVEILVPGVHTYETFIERIKTPYCYGEQYRPLVELCRSIIKRNSIKVIDRHSDLSPGRKYDPGSGFDFDTFLNDIKHIS